MNHIAKLLISLCLYCVMSAVAASDVHSFQAEYLIQQKKFLTQQIKAEHDRLKQLNEQNDVVLKQRFLETEDKVKIAQLKIQSLQLQLENQKNQQTLLSAKLKSFQKSSIHFASTLQTEKTVALVKEELAVGEKNIELIENGLSLFYSYERALLTTRARLIQLLAKMDRDKAIQQLRSENSLLETDLNQLYVQGIRLEHEMQTETKSTLRLLEEKKALLNSQAVDLIQMKLAQNEMQRRWIDAAYSLKENPSMASLQAVSELYQNGIQSLIKQETTLKQELFHLQSEKAQFDTPELQISFQNVVDNIKKHIRELAIQQQILQEDIEYEEAALVKQLSVRSRFSDLRPSNWLTVLSSLIQIPYLFYKYVNNLSHKVYENMIWQDWKINILVLSLLGLVGFIARQSSVRVTTKLKSLTEPARLTGKIYWGGSILLKYNIPYFTGVFWLWIIFYGNGLSYSTFQMLFNLIWVLIVFRNFQLISRLILVDRTLDKTGHDIRLYRRMKGLLILGSVSTLLMVFSHQFPLHEYIQTLSNRLFMLFLFILAVVLWRSKEGMSHLLTPLLKEQKRYIRTVIKVLLYLTPLTLLITAVIGLLGYTNLAWNLSQYQAQLIILVVFYVLLRGVLVDSIEMVSEWMVESLYNGWLWIEVFLKPVDKMMRTLLLLFVMVFIFHLTEETFSITIINRLMGNLNVVILNSPGIFITIGSVFKFIILSLFIMWLAKWTREFCYRWVYHNARDGGIRNSLSVFTQYAVVAVGAFITLRILGFDFAGLSLVLGGLAVGMGFGLRDFANNIVGGLMLLIERPVRVGDLITLGEYEGRVAHIGIRAMRVCSWDNMEVLIPNAETFSKPFINWTHQDSIVRTVIPIKVNRSDNPTMVQQLIIDVLSKTPEILATPAMQVFLTQIDETVMTFEARYFINIDMHPRFEIRSKVLFELTERFKSEGIRPPVPHFQIDF